MISQNSPRPLRFTLLLVKFPTIWS